MIPYFYTIMTVSREAHLVACLWWKRAVEVMRQVEREWVTDWLIDLIGT